MIDKIKSDLKTRLTEKRYIHVMGVVKSAIELCEIYEEDENKAILSAMLHDIAKQMDIKEQEELIKKYDIKLDSMQLSSNELRHSKIGMYMAKYEYGIKDEDVLNAISYHTTGRENMSKLEKIICLADYIEENRNFPQVEKIRDLSKKDLDYALYYALNSTISYLCKNDNLIHIDTILARNYLLQNILIEDKNEKNF